jgi:hypothetical protein
MQSLGESVSTRATSRRGKTRVIGGGPHDHLEARPDNVQLLIALTFAALVPTTVSASGRPLMVLETHANGLHDF